MFFDLDLRGDALPPKTLCLTYDDGPGRTEGDGPGPRTAEIGQFLAARGIAATFFVIGRHAREYPEVVAELRATGHLVGNHTETHPTLGSFLRDGGDVGAEVAQADAAIGGKLDGAPTFFRPPYGDWRDDPVPNPNDLPDYPTPPAIISSVAAALNQGKRFPLLVGPVGWDVDGRDWDCWRSGTSVEACGEGYLAAIGAAGRGIVLMHDSAETAELRAANRTAELTRWLIPRLEERGYRFVRLDAVPGVASAARVEQQIAFGTLLFQWLTCPADSTRIKLTTSYSPAGGRERFGVVPVGRTNRGELVGLRACNGRYLMRTRDRFLVAEGTTIDDSSRWLLKFDLYGHFQLWSSEQEALVRHDHPCTVRLARKPPYPMTYMDEPMMGPVPTKGN